MIRLAVLAIGLLVGLPACSGDESATTGDSLAGGDPAVGQELFAAHCAACHGARGAGTAAGPPLVHEFYVPSHHADTAFLAAVRNGVAPHHWEFGPMPAVPGLDTDDVADIVAYVRHLQREAGLLGLSRTALTP